MKKSTSIRSIAAMMLIFFAITATSCKKESEIAPITPSAPVIPTTPVTPALSVKPVFIFTTENGSTVRKEQFIYDVQGKLVKYESRDASSGLDSVLLFSNSTVFKPTGQSVSQVLTFNTDKTFKSLFIRSDETAFGSNQNKLVDMKKIRQGNSPLTTGQFVYTNNNLSSIGAEIRIDINYHNNLPYQKGINEIPVALKPLKFYKIMEIENATSTVLYSKLIKQVILDSGSRRELHDYTYTFDANNRVTQIRDAQTVVTSTSSVQRVLTSTVSY